MKKTILSSLAIIVAVSSVNAFDAKPKKTTCLVSGEEINIKSAETVNYKGGKLYFCCPGCS